MSFFKKNLRNKVVIGLSLPVIDHIFVNDEYLGAIGGGTTGNILSGLSHHGCPCTILGTIGDDSFGELYKRDLKKFGINTDFLSVISHSITHNVSHLIFTESKTHRFSLVCQKCQKPFIRELDIKPYKPNDKIFKQIKNAACIVIDYPSNGYSSILKTAKDLKIPVFLDGGFYGFLKERASDRYKQVIKFVDYVQFSEFFYNQFISSLGIKSLFDINPKLKGEIITRGNKQGTFNYRKKNRVITQSKIIPWKVSQIIDTSGGGDAFLTGFITTFLQRGHFVDECIDYGNFLAGRTCQFISAKGYLLYALRRNLSLEVDFMSQFEKKTRKKKEMSPIDDTVTPELFYLKTTIDPQRITSICPVCLRYI